MNIWQAIVKLVESFLQKDQPGLAFGSICVIALAMVIPFATLIALRIL